MIPAAIPLILLAVIIGFCISECFQMLFLLSYAPLWIPLGLFWWQCLKDRNSPLLPPLFCTMCLSPFLTWDTLFTDGSVFWMASLLMLNVALCWLVQAVNLQALRACENGNARNALRLLSRLNIRLFIYLVIIPMCAIYVSNIPILTANPSAFMRESWYPGTPLQSIRYLFIGVCLALSAVSALCCRSSTHIDTGGIHHDYSDYRS